MVTPVRDLLIAIFFASCGGHLSPAFIRDLLGLLITLTAAAMGLKFAATSAVLHLWNLAAGQVRDPTT